MKKEDIKKVVLAYSGGLDTSIIIPWLKENYNNCEVIAVSGNVGQADELEGLEEKAIKTGASKLYVLDLTDEYVDEYIVPTLKAGAMYEEYLLGTSHARPCIAKGLVEIAKKENADERKPKNDKFVKVRRELVGFAKTKELEPGEKQIVFIRVQRYHLASYDETGVTGHKACYVLEKGDYEKATLLDDVEVKEGKNVNTFRMKATFKWGQPMLDEESNNGTYYIVKSSKMSVRFQRPFSDDNFKTPNNFLNLELGKAIGIGTNESAVKELCALELGGMFDFPKPTSLNKYE